MIRIRSIAYACALGLSATFVLLFGVTAAAGATATINPASLPAATAGTPYAQTLTVTGSSAPYTLRVTQGTFPQGLTLTTGGAMAGTPTNAGTYAFTVSAFDNAGVYVAFRDYTMSVGTGAQPPPPTGITTINPASLPAPTVGTAYSQAISVSGGIPPYTVRVTQGTFPPGLSLSSSGAVSGTPTASGSFAFTISAFTAAGTYVAFRDYNLTVAAGSGPGAPPPPPPPSPPSGSAYFADDFEGGLRLPWYLSGASNQFSTVPGWSGNGVSLINGASSGGPNGSSQMAALWFANNPEIAHASQGASTWYRVRLFFPSDYQPTTGQWNWAVEWHDDNATMDACSGAVSVALGVYTDYPVVNNAYGKNPRLALRLAGGGCSSPTLRSVELPANSLQRNHWYDLTFHFVWSTSASAGLAEWWVDGQQLVSTSFPTLYTRPDGSSSVNSFGLYNYRLTANWTESMYYDSVRIGPTLASVQ